MRLGPFAQHTSQPDMPDAAVLDIRLNEHDVFLLADDLELYGIPFIFCSGQSPQGGMARFDDHP